MSDSQPPELQHAQVLPFYFLNHQLEPPALRQRIREIKEAGCDGFFIHAREGLLTPYLSEEWFEAVGLCITEAARLGLKAWLYDECPYPSGAAGGRVLEGHPEFTESCLAITRVSVTGGGSRQVLLGSGVILRAWLVPTDESEEACDVTTSTGPVAQTWKVVPWDSRHYYPEGLAPHYDCPRSACVLPENVFSGPVPPGEWQLVAVLERRGGDFLEPFGNYVDVGNPKATERFLNLTHDEYHRRFGQWFGTTVPGIFTDEPKFRNALPWGEGLKAGNGPCTEQEAELLAALAGLGGDQAGLRRRYRETIKEVFQKNWLEPVTGRSHQHGLQLVGHISPEEDWLFEVRYIGSILSSLRLFDVPGCDLIVPAWGDQNHPALNLTVSLAVSAAAQEGRNQVLCEMLGCSDFSLNSATLKRITDWLIVSGINLFVPHGAFHSLDGPRKFDAPPTILSPNPLAAALPAWTQAIREQASQLGPNPAADILIFRPLGFLRSLNEGGEDAAKHLLHRVARLAEDLAKKGLSFHWADEDEADQAEATSSGLRFRKATYRQAIVFEEMDQSAAGKLKLAGVNAITLAEASHLVGPLESLGGIRVAKRKDGGWFCVNLEDMPAVFMLEGTRHSLEAGASGVFHTEEATGSVVLKKPAVHQFSDLWNAHPAGDNCLILDDWSLHGSPVELAPLYELKPEGIGVMGETVFGPVPLQRQLTTTHTLVYEATFSLRQVMPLALAIEKGNLAGTWQIECNGQPLTNWRDSERYDFFNREHALYEELRPGENRLRVSLTAENATDGMLGPCRLFGQFLVEEDASLSCLPPSWQLTGTKGWERQGVPHYSGIIRYSQAFRLEHVGRDLWLELSNPPSNFVSVSINGHRLSSLFWAPWRLRIDDRLLQENNVLALEVSNTLHNMIYSDPRPSGLLATVALKEPSDSR